MQLVTLFWRIWKSRNGVVFNFVQYQPASLAFQFSLQVAEWIENPQESEHQTVVSAPMVSQYSPVSCSLSCFVDSAMKHGLHGAGGWVIQDEAGTLLASAARRYQGLQDLSLVELLALRELLVGFDFVAWLQSL
ncbi:unnamed protein product [Linum trigynum]|uniref:RNase H type-1 domain-containing protein n=1 Tax=Linum trigynum TaxID=586398 RepID=A0AAV2DCX2_9ROSI